MVEADLDVADHRCRRRRHQFRLNYTVSTDHSHHTTGTTGNTTMMQESQKHRGVYFFLHSLGVMHSIVSKMVLNENHSPILY